MPIAIASSPTGATGTSSIVSGTFSPPAGSLLVVLTGTASTPTVSNSGTARTWTQRVVHGTYGGIRIYTAPNPTALSSITVTVAGASGGAKVFVVTGQHPTNPIGTTGTGSTTTNNATVNAYTSTAAGSRGFLVAVDWNGVYLAAPTSTDDEYAWALGDATAGLAATKAANTGTAGAAVQFNLDAAGTSAADWHWVALEILAASLDATINVATVDAAADIPTPTITAIRNATASPAAVDAVADIPTPGVSAGATARPATVDATAAIPTPSVTAGSAQLVEPVTVTATADIPTPTITAIRNATASPVTVDAVADIPTPAITATRQSVISPTTVDAQADIPTPGVSVPVLPGQFITGDFQIEWAGQLYGGHGNVYQVIAGSVEGWDDLPGLDSDSATKPSRHGSWPGRSLAQPREVSAIVAVDDPATFIVSMRALRRNTAVAEDDSEQTLVIRTRGEALLAYASISARSIPTDQYHHGWAQVSLRWLCSDPRRFDLTQQSVVVAANGSQTLLNEGDTATSPRFRIQGPITNPVLLNETTDRVLGFDVTLTSGQLLEIDTQLGTVKIGETSYMSTLSSESVPVEDFVLQPGDNVISYETDSGGTAGAETIWRSAYL